MSKPTPTAYSELQTAYEFLNRALFDSKLPDCLLTLQRKNARTLGYFSPNRFTQVNGGATDELAMNPIHFHSRTTEEVLSTLAHEQVHVWQMHLGKPGRSKYHNKEWGTKMKDIGLYPSNTGEPGGKETGDQMTHYVIKGGAFERASKKLLKTGFRLSWAEDGGTVDPGKIADPNDPAEPKKNKSNRIRYVCPQCTLKAWGKPEIKLMCGSCRIDLKSTGKE